MKSFSIFLFGLFFPELTWKIPSKTKKLFLTFDDGPHPVITPKVLNILDEYDAKATFFCVGENVQKYPETYHQILNRTHLTGNHTYHHLKGWKTPSEEYLSDALKCKEYVQSLLFRPPYGKITPKQVRALKNEGFSVIMWTVLTKDYKTTSKKEKLLKRVISKTKPGSIIVFHDSKKAADNLLYLLPEYLKHFKKKGYSFDVL